MRNSLLSGCLCVAGAALMHFSPASAETWKTFSFRSPDNVPVQIDTDYLVERRELVEARIKARQEKNPLFFLLPDGDVEERYVFNCDANKYALVYRKLTKLQQSTVELDMLPSSVVLADIPKGSIASGAADWVCPEYKKQLAARGTQSGATTPNSRPPPVAPPAKMQENTNSEWAIAAKSADGKDTYLVDLDSLKVEKGVLSFWLRENLGSPTKPRGVSYTSSVERYSTNCVSQQFASGGGTQYDANGRSVGSVEASEAVRVSPGTVAQFIFDAVCAWARGGDMEKSRVFAKGTKDTEVDLREVTTSSTSGTVFFFDAKTAYHDATTGVALVNIAAIYKRAATSDSKTKYYFETRFFSCKENTTDAMAAEAFDAFKRLFNSEYKKVEELKFEPISSGTVMQALANAACSLPDSGSANGTPSTAKSAKSDVIGTGTAWYVDAGYVVTAYHVVEGKKRILLYGSDRKPIVASVVSFDAANDIAVLDAGSAAKPQVALSISKSPITLGSRVFTIGFPHPDLLGLSPKYTAGDVSAITGMGDDPRVFQISVPVQSGNSGGPLVNAAGDVVGIVTGKLSADKVLKVTGDLTQNINYAIKARYLQGMLDDLGVRGKIAKPKVGSVEEIVEQIKSAIFLVVVE